MGYFSPPQLRKKKQIKKVYIGFSKQNRVAVTSVVHNVVLGSPFCRELGVCCPRGIPRGKVKIFLDRGDFNFPLWGSRHFGSSARSQKLATCGVTPKAISLRLLAFSISSSKSHPAKLSAQRTPKTYALYHSSGEGGPEGARRGRVVH